MQFSVSDIAAMLGISGDTVELGVYAGIKTYPCIFDAPGKAPNMFTGSIETTVPAITMSADDLAESGAVHGDLVLVNGSDRYAITATDPDGYGFVIVSLTKDYE